MLENAVDGLTKLRYAKTSVAQLNITNGTVTSYDGYVSLLYGATQSYDTHFSIRISSKGKNAQYINIKLFHMNIVRNMNIMLTHM